MTKALLKCKMMVNTRRMELRSSNAITKQNGNYSDSSSADETREDEPSSLVLSCWTKPKMNGTGDVRTPGYYTSKDTPLNTLKNNEHPRNDRPTRNKQTNITYDMDTESEDVADESFIFAPVEKRSHRLRYRKRKRARLDSPVEEIIVDERLRDRGRLRPLKRESYNAEYFSESSDEKPDIGIRRSQRKKNFKYDTFNTSWITDFQMFRGNIKSETVRSNNPNMVGVEQSVKIEPTEEAILENPRMVTRKRENAVLKKPFYDYSTSNSAKEDVPLKQLKEHVNDEEKNTEVVKTATVTNQTSPDKLNGINNTRRRVLRFKPKSRHRSDYDSSDVNRSYRYRLRQRKPKPIIPRIERQQMSCRRILRKRPLRQSRSSSSSSSSEDDRDRKTGLTSMQLDPSRIKVAMPSNRNKMRSKLSECQIKPVNPTVIDRSITFASIGGLDEQVRSMREMVVLPMLYPEIFKRFNIAPPKGVLFHGPPGTGKTLMARALANECSGTNRKVTFFMRKGADLLSKWVGQTEKHMTSLFEQAAQMAPSIIFFDELDGLAPARTSRQEQVHISVVASLLSLMDGLDKSRGDVIVIGATNRPDAIDAALRRPGRFDREIYFPLPSAKQREDILRIILSNWPETIEPSLVTSLAEISVGYCGADLRALCTETMLRAVRRTYPQIYRVPYRLLIDTQQIKPCEQDFMDVALRLVPATARGLPVKMAQKIPRYLEPLLNNCLDNALNLVNDLFAFAKSDLSTKCLADSQTNKSARLVLMGDGASYVSAAILFQLEHLPVLKLDLTTLHDPLYNNPEQACLQILNEARRNAPSVIFMPDVDQWLENVSDAIQVMLQQQALAGNAAILFLATCAASCDLSACAPVASRVFSQYRRELFTMPTTNESDREQFFLPLIMNRTTMLPDLVSDDIVDDDMEMPPRAPTPPPPPLSPRSKQLLVDAEESTLNELRIFLREVCKKLARNKGFECFVKPVDLSEVPDYLEIVEQPMDLQTMMHKLDLHQYSCARQFLDDIDLIQANALKYNPDRTDYGRNIRHLACWFRDTAHALIKKEMDTDFEDKCRGITKARDNRKTNNPFEFLPPRVRAMAEEDLLEKNTASSTNTATTEMTATAGTSKTDATNANKTHSPPTDWKRRRKFSAWARGGLPKKRVKTTMNETVTVVNDDDDDLLNECLNDSQPKSNDNSLINPAVNVSDDNSKENHPDVEDVCEDESTKMNRSVKTTPKKVCSSPAAEMVTVNVTELNTVLQYAVKVTTQCTISPLCELYNQLERIIKKYSDLYDRSTLPRELMNELDRFRRMN